MGKLLESMIAQLLGGLKKVEADYGDKEISAYRIGDKQIRIDIKY